MAIAASMWRPVGPASVATPVSSGLSTKAKVVALKESHVAYRAPLAENNASSNRSAGSVGAGGISAGPISVASPVVVFMV
jgi:hypothetical protein